VLTFIDNFPCAISSPTFPDGLLRGFPLRAAYADEHRVGHVHRKISGSYGDTCSILVDQRVDSRSGNAGRCPWVTQSSFDRESANDLIPRMSAALRDAPHSSPDDDSLYRVILERRDRADMPGLMPGHRRQLAKNVACHDQTEQTVPVSRSKRRSSGRTNAPCPVAGARRSLLPHHRSRTGKPTNHRQRTDRSSAGQTPHRPAAQVSLGGTATHDAAHGSHNHAFCRLLPPPTRQSRCRRNDSSRATHRRRDIEARQGSRRCDQRHRDEAERAIQAARGDGYADSQKVNGVRHPTLKA
jgi:hypothetical protein